MEERKRKLRESFFLFGGEWKIAWILWVAATLPPSLDYQRLL